MIDYSSLETETGTGIGTWNLESDVEIVSSLSSVLAVKNWIGLICVGLGRVVHA
jgi:hypothetical protein